MKSEIVESVPRGWRATGVVGRLFVRTGSRAIFHGCVWSALLGACTLTGDDFTPPGVSSDAPPDAPAPGGSGGVGPTSPDTGGTSDVPADPPPASSDDPSGPPVVVGPGGSGSPDPVDVDGGDAGTVTPIASLVLPDPTQLVGWASVAGLGVETTTGGGLDEVVIARSAAELVDFAARTEPLTIAIEGSLDVGGVAVASNKTLVGIGPDATLRGGIAIRGTAEALASNVIISNLNIEAATSSVDGDGIQIQFAHHVWIDHCALSDAGDGLLDIEHGSDFVTVSHTRLFYTALAPNPAHQFANQTGHELQNGAEDSGHLNVTWHHDFWGDGVTRASLGRYGRIHVFDNLFRSAGNNVVISAGFASSWLVENNHFEDVASPMAILPQSGASVVAANNVFVRTSGAQDTGGTAFVPPYAYALEPTTGLDARIIAESGPR